MSHSRWWIVTMAVAVGCAVGAAMGQEPAGDRSQVIREDELSADAPSLLAYQVQTKDEGSVLYAAGPGLTKPMLLSGDLAVSGLGPGGELAFAWAPNGGAVAFTTEVGTESAVYLVSPTTAQAACLAPRISGRATAPVWAPSGAYLAVKPQSGAATGAAVIETATGRVVRLGEQGVESTLWSPQGDTLAIVKTTGIDLWSSASGVVLPLAHGEAHRAGAASWSHNGELLAFDSTRADGSSGVVVARPAAGTFADVGMKYPGLRLVEMSPSEDALLAFTPSTTGLKLLRFRPPWKEGEDLTALAGKTHVAPAPEAGGQALAAFSQSGAAVAFVAAPADSALSRYLYVLQPQGAPRCVSQPVGVQAFTWSPDSKLIGFTGRRGSVGRLSQTLYVANLTTGGYAQLAANVIHFEWQPRSSALAVFSVVSTTRQVALGIVRGSDKKLSWVDIGVVGGKWCPE